MIQSAAVTLIGFAFVAISVLLIASGHMPWTSPDPWTVMTFFAGCAIVGLVETVQRRWPPRPVSTPSRFAARFNRAQFGVFALAGALWCASGWLGLFSTVYPSWVSWMVLVFGGVCAVLLGGFVFDGREQVIIDHGGIADRRIVRDKIPWGDMRSIATGYTGGVLSVAITLHDPARYRSRRPWFARALGRSVEPVHVISLQLTATAEDILAAISRFAPPKLQEQRVWFDDDDLA